MVGGTGEGEGRRKRERNLGNGERGEKTTHMERSNISKKR